MIRLPAPLVSLSACTRIVPEVVVEISPALRVISPVLCTIIFSVPETSPPTDKSCALWTYDTAPFVAEILEIVTVLSDATKEST